MKVAVGLSGGVDSAIAAFLLRERGEEVVGVTMALGRPGEARALDDARAVAERLDVTLHVFDLAREWSEHVLDYVRETYLAGSTPNPCIRCNETVKFGLLPHLAFNRLGCERFATGHYARTSRASASGRVRLLRGVDHAKDQSYFLYRVRPDVLERTEFPLGGLTKDEVRARARQLGLAVADREESQDFCGGDPMRIVGAADREGDIVTESGKVLGRHRGFWHYTVGMRKGLGIGGGTPYYVIGLDAARNRVTVGFREAAVSHDLELKDTVGEIDRSLPVKVRSACEPRLLADGIVGVAPGQSAVFYRGDEVVGGGIISDSKSRIGLVD